jgi:hypothetical protein
VTPYALAIGDVVITGEYAVLRSSRPKKHAFALYLRHGGLKIRPLVQDIVSFARRLDLSKSVDRPVKPTLGDREYRSHALLGGPRSFG